MARTRSFPLDLLASRLWKVKIPCTSAILGLVAPSPVPTEPRASTVASKILAERSALFSKASPVLIPANSEVDRQSGGAVFVGGTATRTGAKGGPKPAYGRRFMVIAAKGVFAPAPGTIRNPSNRGR